jgi:dihydroxy-acid dehydratase
MLREIIEQLDKLPQKVMANSLEMDVSMPVVGIVSAQSELSLAQNGLNELVKRVKEGVISAGGYAKVLHVPSIDVAASHGTDCNKYELPLRDLTADAVEILTSCDIFDALVFVVSEGAVAAGMLLGAIRVNIPCTFVFGGVMTPLLTNGKQHGLLEIYRQVARLKTGKLSRDNLNRIQNNLPINSGTDCETYGANAFNCVLEALGLAVGGNSTAPSLGPTAKGAAYTAGRNIIKVANSKLTPKRMLTHTALLNASTFDLACGGDGTTQLNLIAIAKEVGDRNFTLKTISDLGKTTPVLLGAVDGSAPLMYQFDNAGGVYGMVKQLTEAKLFNADFDTCTGRKMAEEIADVTVDEGVIRPQSNAVMASATLRVLYGNVAEEGCLCHFHGENTFSGYAKVYQSEESAIDALLHREIKPDDILVIKSEGPKSAPGMRQIYMALSLLEGLGLNEKVAVITDGRVAGFFKGIAVGHVTPETSAKGMFSILQDGDEIEISVVKGKVSTDIKAREQTLRFRDLDLGTANYSNRFLKEWSKAVSPATDGCVKVGKK